MYFKKGNYKFSILITGKLPELHPSAGVPGLWEASGLRYEQLQALLQGVQRPTRLLPHGKREVWPSCLSLRPGT